MRFFAERVHTGGVDPAVIEIEERTNRNGVIDGRIRPAGFVQRGDIRRSDVYRIAIHLIDEAQQDFLARRQRRRFEIFNNGCDQGFIPQQFRRNCGVGFHSKRAIIARGSVSRNELAQAGTERGRFAHDGLREALEVLGGMRLKCEQMPDLRVLGAGVAGGSDEIGERAFGFRGFHVAEKHGFHDVDLASVLTRLLCRGAGYRAIVCFYY